MQMIKLVDWKDLWKNSRTQLQPKSWDLRCPKKWLSAGSLKEGFLKEVLDFVAKNSLVDFWYIIYRRNVVSGNASMADTLIISESEKPGEEQCYLCSRHRNDSSIFRKPEVRFILAWCCQPVVFLLFHIVRAVTHWIKNPGRWWDGEISR